MKQIMQLLMLLAVVAIIIFFMQQHNQPGGYRQVEKTTVTKYKKEAPTQEAEHPKTEFHSTVTEKATKEGSKVTVKERTKTTSH